MSPLEQLRDYLQENGSIQTIRVSSAQAKGAAKKYCYWGAVRYCVRINLDGTISNVAQERASSDRRSQRLAKEDADAIATKEGRIKIHTIGRISESTAQYILDKLGVSCVTS